MKLVWGLMKEESPSTSVGEIWGSQGALAEKSATLGRIKKGFKDGI